MRRTLSPREQASAAQLHSDQALTWHAHLAACAALSTLQDSNHVGGVGGALSL